MPKHIADREIGYRSFEVLITKYGSVKKILQSTPIQRSTLYEWKSGVSVPSAYWLQYLCEIGADVRFILLGRKG